MRRSVTRLVPPPPRARRGGLALVLSLAALGAPALPVSAQESCEASSRRLVCGLELRLTDAAARDQRVDGRRPLAIPAGTSVELEAIALDGTGRTFPAERMRWGLDLERGCERLVEIDEREVGRWRIRASLERGTCEATLWVPGNLDLEWPLVLEVVSRARDGYSRLEAEHLADRLYETLFARPADAEGRLWTVTEIQRGRLDEQIRTLVASVEYREKRGTQAPSELLEALYRGLLGRAPDTVGVRDHLPLLERSRIAEVVVRLVRSEEFERQLLGKVGAAASAGER